MTADPRIVEIADPLDPRLADYLSLTDVALRSGTEPELGLFIGEGELVIRRALEAGYSLRSVLTSHKWLPALENALRGHQVPLLLADPAVLKETTGFHVHRGALAAFARKPVPDATHLVANARRVVVLEDINSHTNLGSIFRAAAGLGIDAVLLSPSCADPLYRRSVRVSMGQVFAVPYGRFSTWPAELDVVRAAGFTLCALTPDSDAEPIAEVAGEEVGKVAILLGAEGPGLTRRALRGSDRRVRIPMANGVDSLNVAAAAAVAFFAFGQAKT